MAEQQAAQLASLRAAYAADVVTLEKLERTNVYNDAFCIGHDGVFGTINGLRLGRVPGVPVSCCQTLLDIYPPHSLGGMGRDQCCLGTSSAITVHYSPEAGLYIHQVWL